MTDSPSMQEVLERVGFLMRRYSLERRATAQPFLIQELEKHFKDYQYQPQDAVGRETLIEHVGSLPVVATALYPYIDDPEVDLGKALVMLAIHDIGELVTGDESTFTKKSEAAVREHQEALKLLDPSYHELYMEVESKSSKTAKFAKAVDKITPDILDYLTPAEITVPRLKVFARIEKDQIIDTIVKHKRPYMIWNPFMTQFHIFLMKELAKVLG